MKYAITTATKKIAGMKARIRAIPGGTGAGKTIGVLQYLIVISENDTEPKITSIVSESFPHLRRGAMRDFLNIVKVHNIQGQWDKTNSVFTFKSNSKIEFFSVDQPDKLRGGRRDRLFINESNNVSFEAFEELEVRTKEIIILDWNPVSEFWYYTQLKENRTDVEELTLTYEDNELLSKETVQSIEQRRSRKGWWQVYGLGQLGEVEGRIYSGWRILEEMPFEAKIVCYGLDFGYTNDPSVILSLYYLDGGYILDELAYSSGMLNKDIADVILSQEEPHVIVYADSAEPKSIDEIKKYGVNILGTKKGRDSVSFGIQLIQDQKISVTSRSVNLIRDYRNYLWKTDRQGKVLNVPEHEYSHGMDALRYAITASHQKFLNQEDFMRKYRANTFYDATMDMWRK